MMPPSRPPAEIDAISDEADHVTEPAPAPADRPASPPSRIDRIKAKIARLGGKNPDIYPMW